ALIAAMEHPNGFSVYNVGTGKNYDLNELVEKLNQKLGKEIKPKYIEMPVKNYVMETLASTEKAEKQIGFKAKVSLDEGLDRIIEYYK
ncbi:MAG: nucleoside-diphosphate sugar epimerase, partial [Candidatus Parvarchaeum sp.]